MPDTKLTAEPGKQEVVVTHIFDAPRDLVFKIMMDPTLVAQWWGPRDLTTIVEKMEVKKGGIWRFIQRDASGSEFAFNGVYHEILAPERVIDTFEFEPMPGHVLLESMTLVEQDGKTILTSKLIFQSVEDRDGMVNSGMESGQAESMERLAELLKQFQKEAHREMS